jgi:hypothetical protein
MSVSIITELVEFEKKESEILEKRKNKLMLDIGKERAEILEKNRHILDNIKKERKEIIKEATAKAKAQAKSTIKSFKTKAEKISKIPKERIDAAVDIIINDFFNKNV